MANNKQSGRFIAEKLAIPAILVISILVARLVVELKTVIILTGPFELSRLGVSVSMPSGN